MADQTPTLPALKPCPFCGGPVELEEAASTWSAHFGSRQWWGVVCRNTTNLGGTCGMEQRPSASKEAAVERWNRRAGAEAKAEQARELSDAEIDRHIDAVLRAAGSALKHYTLPKSISDMRAAMRAILAAASQEPKP